MTGATMSEWKIITFHYSILFSVYFLLRVVCLQLFDITMQPTQGFFLLTIMSGYLSTSLLYLSELVSVYLVYLSTALVLSHASLQTLTHAHSTDGT